MKKEEIENLYKLYEQFENEVIYVFDELDNNGLLDFYNNSYESFEIDSQDLNMVSIKYYDYGYDLYESSYIEIPTKILGDANEISKYIEKLKKEKELKDKLEKERKLKQEKEIRRKKYEELKQEFEHN